MIAFAALLIALLMAVVMDKRLSDEARAKLGSARVIRAQVAAAIIDFAIAYVLLRGLLSVTGH